MVIPKMENIFCSRILSLKLWKISEYRSQYVAQYFIINSDDYCPIKYSVTILQNFFVFSFVANFVVNCFLQLIVSVPSINSIIMEAYLLVLMIILLCYVCIFVPVMCTTEYLYELNKQII